jgi:sugar/nucleoside kinase (ribokinase family)
VDEGSRTIIHTPGYEMTGADMDERCLDGASLVYIDGRHPEAALCVSRILKFPKAQVARWAVVRNLPIIFDLERRRGSPEGFDELIRSATILSMSKWVPLVSELIFQRLRILS